jgi:putative phage-type endonuclease
MQQIDPNELDFEPFINEKCSLDLIESAFHLMEDYLTENPSAYTEPDFHETMFDEIRDIFYIQFSQKDDNDAYILDELDDILEEAFELFCIQKNIEPNPESNTIEYDADMIEEKINLLRAKPQPEQRTKAWYEFRHTLISASSASKAFGSESMVNQLIYEKCQPLRQAADDANIKFTVNVDTSLHWGQKYEPLSVLIYEHLYNTKVEDFGCIRHDIYDFIGASPDGINVDPESDRYGRMLEIKNVVSREITGIPKTEYYVQMQLQMEVCDLDECDFLETKFVEYPDYAAYLADVNPLPLAPLLRGFIIYFHMINEQKPKYIYKPIHIQGQEQEEEWEQETLDKYSGDPNLTWIKNCYWKLEVMSCILVARNKQWFNDSIGQLEKVWRIIEEERITGCEHRAPKKRANKQTELNGGSGCLLTIKKLP